MPSSADEPAPAKPAARRWVRAVVDYLGLLGFLIGFFATKNILSATWALVAGSVLGLAFGFVMERRIAPLPLLVGGAGLLFGGLALFLHDPRLIKIKPTVVNLGLGVAMLAGLALRRNPLKVLMGDTLSLSEAGWRKLTLRYGLFFLALAVLNEVVWRTQPDHIWVVFRFPGMAILAVLFSFTQVPLMLKDHHALEAAARTAETQD